MRLDFHWAASSFRQRETVPPRSPPVEPQRAAHEPRKKLDMGKACIRFRTTDDLAMDAVADVVSSVTVDQCVEIAAAARRRH